MSRRKDALLRQFWGRYTWCVLFLLFSPIFSRQVPTAVLSRTENEKVSIDWSRAFDSLSNGCLISLAHCRNSSDGSVVGGLLDRNSCERENLTWWQAYESSLELRRASDLVFSRFEREGVKYRVHLVGGSTRAPLSGDSKTFAMGDTLKCMDGSIWTFVDAPSGEIHKLGGFGFVLPDALKVSPYLKSYEKRHRVDKGMILRRIQLSPGSAGRARKVMKKWMRKHAARRRLLVDKVDTRWTLYIGTTVHEGRMLSSLDSDFDDDADELIVATPKESISLDWLSAESEASWVEPVIDFHLFNMDAALMVQDGTILDKSDFSFKDSNARFWSNGVAGRGEIVGVADSGLDTDHCFFKDENVAVRNLTVNETYMFPYHRKVLQYVTHVDGTEGGGTGGHGTHVAGTVAGFTTQAPGSYVSNIGDNANAMKGVAYDSRIAFFDIGEPGSTKVFPPRNLAKTMFPPAYNAGARIHTNSWGSDLNSYTTDARNIDRYTWEHQDFVVIVAAGNAGPLPGGSIGTPATSKNAIAVGANMNSKRSFSFLGLACTAVPYDWDCSNNLASFSANGPTSDSRLKPDVVAPGFYVGSADSGTECDISWQAGTSMAAPVVAGAAALVRQFLKEGFYPLGVVKSQGFEPMGALVKAILINGAEYLTGVYVNGMALAGDRPDNNQGFGLINLANVLLFSGNKATRSTFLDGDMASMPLISKLGNNVTYHVFVVHTKEDPTTSLKVTLAWYDPGASLASSKTLMNDLDLVVVSPKGREFLGNEKVFPSGDHTNNVEQVDIPGTVVGQEGDGMWTIRVQGFDVLPDSPQPFALVATGPMKVEDQRNIRLDENSVSSPMWKSVDNTQSSGGSVAGAVIGSICAVAVLSVGAIKVAKNRREKKGAFPTNASSPHSQMVASVPKETKDVVSTGGKFSSTPTQRAPDVSKDALPRGWQRAFDENTKTFYYYNREKNISQWDRPGHGLF